MEASSVIVRPRWLRIRCDSQEFLKCALINARKNRMRQENIQKSPKIKATSQNGYSFHNSVTDRFDEEEDFDEVFDHQNKNMYKVEQDSDLVSFDEFFSALNVPEFTKFMPASMESNDRRKQRQNVDSIEPSDDDDAFRMVAASFRRKHVHESTPKKIKLAKSKRNNRKLVDNVRLEDIILNIVEE